jgi:signal transduction histidine kinase
VPLLFVSPRHGDGASIAKAEPHGEPDDFVGAAIPAELRAKILGFVELHRHTRALERECELQGAADDGQDPPDRSDCRVRVEASALRGEMAADKRMNVRLQLLTGVASELLRRTAPIEPSDIIATRFVQRLGYDVCVSYLREPDGGSVSIAEAVGIEGPPWSHPRAALDDSPAVRAVFGAQGRYVRGSGDTDALPDWLRDLDLPSLAVFPILRTGATIGALVCGRRDGTEPAAEDIAAIQLVCDQIAMANERDHLTHALVEHADALALADRRKDEFLAMLAHELRNPLAPMSYALELLHQLDRAPASAALHDVLHRQLSHLSRMVDDLLDVSRITNGKLTLVLAPVTVQQAIAHALETSRPQLDKRGHHVVVEVPGRELKLNADAERIVQVIANLLNNAARYTDPGGHIVVAARQDGGFAVVDVRDDGHGLAPEMLPRVFDLFVQASAPASAPRPVGSGWA